MKKFALLLLCLLLPLTALADKAQFVSTDEDSAYHDSHLEKHIGDEDLICAGRAVKLRASASASAKVTGRMGQNDTLKLLSVKGGFAEVEVLETAANSPAYEGMTGWADADYVQCSCGSAQYYGDDEDEGETPVTDSLTAYSCTADNLRVRTAPKNGEVIGHIEKADRFRLLDEENGWAYIEVTYTAPKSRDSWVGLSGWVSKDYIDYTGYRQIGTVQKASSRWKRAYLNYLNGYSREELRDSSFALILVNDDEIPELWFSAVPAASGNHLLTYANGKVQELENSHGFIRYYKRGSKVWSCGGMMGSYVDGIYTISGGRWKQTAGGEYYGMLFDYSTYEDDDETSDQDYSWNGASVSRYSYWQSLRKAFSLSASLEPECMTWKGITAVLSD